VVVSGRPCCWVTLDEGGYITVPEETLKQYGAELGIGCFLLGEVVLV
jgi:hypothetical protein